jgi:hypothetical protein
MSNDDNGPDDRDEIPRRSFWSSLPKRSLSRVLILLGLLAGIVYLRERTGSIAGCMSQAFLAPAANPPGVRVRGPRVVPSTSPGVTPGVTP